MRFISFLSTPYFWVFLAGVTFLIYGFAGRLAYVNITGIIKQYRKVFSKTIDFIFFITFPLFIAIASTLHANVDDELSNLLAVVLAILTSMVLTFMALTSDSSEHSLKRKDKDLGDRQLIVRNRDTLAVGTYEILISIIVLILILLIPLADGNSIANKLMSFLIYYGFYSFLLNLFIMVRRLFQVLVNK